MDEEFSVFFLRKSQICSGAQIMVYTHLLYLADYGQYEIMINDAIQLEMDFPPLLALGIFIFHFHLKENTYNRGRYQAALFLISRRSEVLDGF